MNKKVFISYSWSNPNHEDWVLHLAQRLRADAVDVILDKWDLKEGQDKYEFMEAMVNSEDVEKVLMILDEKYKVKANLRTGGVGTETQIISPQIYENVSQEKFIPIIAEKDQDGQPYMPAYLKGRMYIDLSNVENFEETYEDLLRNIYNKPRHRKPELGKAPAYLFEETPNKSATSILLRRLSYVIDKKPEKIDRTIKEFLDTYLESLNSFTLKFDTRDSTEVGKKICDNINLYTDLRDDYISFINKVLLEKLEFDFDLIVEFFERLPSLEEPREGVGSYMSYTYDNFKFITYETFLYAITLGLINKNYVFIKNMVQSSYFIETRDNYNKEVKDFSTFYRKINSIDKYYKETFDKNFFNPMADLIITRLPKGVEKKDIVLADLICLHHAILNDQHWFPQTYIYHTVRAFPIFQKLISKRHFAKVKDIFAIQNKEELIEQMKKIKSKIEENPHQRFSYSRFFDSAPLLYQLVNIETLCTKT